MDNANVLLTGASSGFGKLIAVTLANAGHRVFAGMRAPRGRNSAAAEELSSLNTKHRIVPVDLDVTSDASVSTAVDGVLKGAGRIDILVNCAGIMWLGTTEAYSTSQLDSILQTNLVGPFRLFKAVLPSMRARRDGLLITITSTAGRFAAAGFGIYSASKFGLEGLAEVLGYEVSGLGIDSVIVEPGPFPTTGLMAGQQDPAERNVVAEYGEFGRFPERLPSRTVSKVGASLPPSMQPQLVADLVRDLIAMPKGRRPVRTTVGMDFGLQQLNETTRRFQQQFLAGLGFGDVERTNHT